MTWEYELPEDSYPKLNPQVKEKWLEALRSGEYTQGTNYLRCESGFCCLGVRNELAVQAGVIDPPVLFGSEEDGYWEYNQAAGISSDREAAWAYGLEHPGSRMTDDTLLRALDADEFLATLNDDGMTFAEISDWIEAHL